MPLFQDMCYNTHMSVDETIQTALHSIRSFVPNAKVYLFGSRARNDAQKYSDIDLGILADYRIDSRVMLDMIEKLEEIRSFYPVQIVDLKNVSVDFYKKVMDYAKEIHEQ